VGIVAASAAFAIATFTFMTNIAIAVAARGALGLAIGGLSVWALVLESIYAIAFWPILLDPHRDLIRARDKARLAAVATFGLLGRLVLVAVTSAIVLVVSVYGVILLATLAIAFVAAVMTRVVLPAVDIVEARGVRRGEDGVAGDADTASDDRAD
jgi:hypothetical protein